MSLSKSSFVSITILSALAIAIIYNYIFFRFCRLRRQIHRRGSDPPLQDLERGYVGTSIFAVIPSCKFSADPELDVKDKTCCSVCLNEFKDGEDVRVLPQCSHSFHVPCIDMWLQSHPECPVCRTDTGISVPICRRLETEPSSETSS